MVLDLIWALTFLGPRKFGPPRSLGPKKFGLQETWPCMKIHIRHFLGEQISCRLNFLETKFLANQKSWRPKCDRGPFLL